MVARTCIVALIIVSVVLFGASYVWHNSPASQIAPIRSGDDPATIAFQVEVEKAYETGDLDYMERMADALRKDESRVAGGNTKLFELYNVLAAIRCWCRDGARMVHSFEDRKARLEQWLAKYPRSVTATLAMAVLWEYRSLEIVGGELDAEATEEQRAQSYEARRIAASYLEKLSVSDDPYVAFFALRILRYTDATPEEAARLFTASTAAWPRHYQAYFQYTHTLAWMFDDAASRDALMRELAAAKDDPDKQVGLAYIVSSLFRYYRFQFFPIPWEDVKHAYAVRRELYGWRNRDLNVICYLAVLEKDWPFAKNCMAEINGRWDDRVWNSQNDFVWNELIVSLH
jgi:hypothetical protein